MLNNPAASTLLRMMHAVFSCQAVYKMRANKFSVTAFLHNQNLLTHECTHHIYAEAFLRAVEDRQKEFEKGMTLQKYYKNLLGEAD